MYNNFVGGLSRGIQTLRNADEEKQRLAEEQQIAADEQQRLAFTEESNRQKAIYESVMLPLEERSEQLKIQNQELQNNSAKNEQDTKNLGLVAAGLNNAIKNNHPNELKQWEQSYLIGYNKYYRNALNNGLPNGQQRMLTGLKLNKDGSGYTPEFSVFDNRGNLLTPYSTTHLIGPEDVNENLYKNPKIATYMLYHMYPELKPKQKTVTYAPLNSYSVVVRGSDGNLYAPLNGRLRKLSDLTPDELLKIQKASEDLQALRTQNSSSGLGIYTGTGTGTLTNSQQGLAQLYEQTEGNTGSSQNNTGSQVATVSTPNNTGSQGIDVGLTGLVGNNAQGNPVVTPQAQPQQAQPVAPLSQNNPITRGSDGNIQVLYNGQTQTYTPAQFDKINQYAAQADYSMSPRNIFAIASRLAGIAAKSNQKN